MGRNPTKELREKIELLSEELHEEQNKRALCDTIIAIFLVITFFIAFLTAMSPTISAWYRSLDEFNKGATIGVVASVIMFCIAWIIFPRG
jgi:ABC-type molybdenum transport system ATPase subunit/photorepair protein PhrA